MPKDKARRCKTEVMHTLPCWEEKQVPKYPSHRIISNGACPALGAVGNAAAGSILLQNVRGYCASNLYNSIHSTEPDNTYSAMSSERSLGTGDGEYHMERGSGTTAERR